MYFWEWLIYNGIRKGGIEEMRQKAEQARIEGRGAKPATVKSHLSSEVSDNDSLYAYNDTYIDVRTPHDEKRGLITLVLGWMLGFLVWFFCEALNLVVNDWLLGHDTESQSAYIYDIVLDIIFPAIPGVALFFYFKYLHRFLRLEAFTARRIVVRFNRVTRKVYLLRPKNIGGIKVLDWDKTTAAVDASMRREVLPGGGFLALDWQDEGIYNADGSPGGEVEFTFVGRTTANGAELLAFWEYIRSYMEIGPQAAPPPKELLSKTPWPWLSFQAAWNILPLRGLRQSGLFGAFLLVKLMLLPVTIIHATGHWISLLLCYEPRFPKAIEKAGQ